MADPEVNLESNDAKELLRTGHHALVIKDYTNAAAALGKATQLMAQEHGDEADILGEIYLRYGRSLLELAREEGPLGEAVPKELHSEEEEDDDDEEEPKENGINGDAGPSTSNGHMDGAPNGDAAPEEEDKEEPSDLQLAWEVFEVAKKIFAKRGDQGRDLLAETLILLGEVGMESENFGDAVKDIKEGLDIQEDLYEKNNRKVAETQYKLAMAHSNLSNIEDAVMYYESAIETLRNRIEFLKSVDEESGKEEIEEIDELIPEIREKINDVKSIKEETTKVLMEMSTKPAEKGDGAGPSSSSAVVPSSAASSSTKEVQDISHLVKRKRKIDETTEEKEKPEDKSEDEPSSKKSNV